MGTICIGSPNGSNFQLGHAVPVISRCRANWPSCTLEAGTVREPMVKGILAGASAALALERALPATDA